MMLAMKVIVSFLGKLYKERRICLIVGKYIFLLIGDTFNNWSSFLIDAFFLSFFYQGCNTLKVCVHSFSCQFAVNNETLLGQNTAVVAA